MTEDKDNVIFNYIKYIAYFFILTKVILLASYLLSVSCMHSKYIFFKSYFIFGFMYTCYIMPVLCDICAIYFTFGDKNNFYRGHILKYSNRILVCFLLLDLAALIFIHFYIIAFLPESTYKRFQANYFYVSFTYAYLPFYIAFLIEKLFNKRIDISNDK